MAPKCYFFRAGSLPAPAPLAVCIPRAGTFQRQLAVHVKAGLRVVFLPAIGTFQYHSAQQSLHYWPPSVFTYVSAVSLGLCSTYWVWRLDQRLRLPIHQVWWALPMYITRSWSGGFSGFRIKCITPLGLRRSRLGIAPRRHKWPSHAVWAVSPVG
jgi:hypothetical protein